VHHAKPEKLKELRDEIEFSFEVIPVHNFLVFVNRPPSAELLRY
jgi:hypothetical protein